MSFIEKVVYHPLIKTRDAELRGFDSLGFAIMDQILPVYELTKSRKTTKAPDGDIYKRMLRIGEIQKGRPFVLDLCTDDKYRNPQIDQLLDEDKGYSNWQLFLNVHSDLNIIPMVHLYDEQDFQEVERFVREVSQDKEFLAVRLPYDLDDICNYVTPITSSMAAGCKLIVFLDANYIRGVNEEYVVGHFVRSSQNLAGISGIERTVMLATSFPRSPAALGGDTEGGFDIFEEAVYEKASKQVVLHYGDYASINTEQVEIKGGNFVPRIDIALDKEFIYKRYRRHEGSYPLCAEKMVNDRRYKTLHTWADSEIQIAKSGNPTGRSPSFWIAVRINYYVTSRVLLRVAS